MRRIRSSTEGATATRKRATRVPFFIYAPAEGKRLLEINPTAIPLEVLCSVCEGWIKLDEASREVYESEAASRGQVVEAEFPNVRTPLPKDEEVDAKEEVREPESRLRRLRRMLMWLFCCGWPKPLRPKMKSKL